MVKKKYKKPDIIEIKTDMREMVKNGTGGCPYLFLWDGKKYIKENNILPQSENWLMHKKVVEDKYILQNKPIVNACGIKLKFKEFEREMSWLNKVELMAIEHKANNKIGVTHEGKILNYKLKVSPTLSCKNNKGENCTEKVSNLNWVNSKKYYNVKPEDSLEFTFKKPQSDNLKFIIIDPKEDNWFDVNIKDHMSKKVEHRAICMDIYLSEGIESVNIFPYRMEFCPDIIDLTPYLPKMKDNVKIKLKFFGHYKLAFVGIDTTSAIYMKKKSCKLIKATHSRLENVTDILREENDQFVSLIPGEEIKLNFPVPESPNKGNKISYKLDTKGYYISMDELIKENKEIVCI